MKGNKQKMQFVQASEAAAYFERKQMYEEAVSYWQKAKKLARKEANQKWCEARAALCQKRGKKRWTDCSILLSTSEGEE